MAGNEPLVNEAAQLTEQIAGFMHIAPDELEKRKDALQKTLADVGPEALHGYVDELKNRLPGVQAYVDRERRQGITVDQAVNEAANFPDSIPAQTAHEALHSLNAAVEMGATAANPNQDNFNTSEFNLRNATQVFLYGDKADVLTDKMLLHPSLGWNAEAFGRRAGHSFMDGFSWFGTGASNWVAGVWHGTLRGWDTTNAPTFDNVIADVARTPVEDQRKISADFQMKSTPHGAGNAGAVAGTALNFVATGVAGKAVVGGAKAIIGATARAGTTGAQVAEAGVDTARAANVATTDVPQAATAAPIPDRVVPVAPEPEPVAAPTPTPRTVPEAAPADGPVVVEARAPAISPQHEQEVQDAINANRHPSGSNEPVTPEPSAASSGGTPPPRTPTAPSEPAPQNGEPRQFTNVVEELKAGMRNAADNSPPETPYSHEPIRDTPPPDPNQPPPRHQSARQAEAEDGPTRPEAQTADPHAEQPKSKPEPEPDARTEQSRAEPESDAHNDALRRAELRKAQADAERAEHQAREAKAKADAAEANKAGGENKGSSGDERTPHEEPSPHEPAGATAEAKPAPVYQVKQVVGPPKRSLHPSTWRNRQSTLTLVDQNGVPKTINFTGEFKPAVNGQIKVIGPKKVPTEIKKVVGHSEDGKEIRVYHDDGTTEIMKGKVVPEPTARPAGPTGKSSTAPEGNSSIVPKFARHFVEGWRGPSRGRSSPRSFFGAAGNMLSNGVQITTGLVRGSVPGGRFGYWAGNRVANGARWIAGTAPRNPRLGKVAAKIASRTTKPALLAYGANKALDHYAPDFKQNALDNYVNPILNHADQDISSELNNFGYETPYIYSAGKVAGTGLVALGETQLWGYSKVADYAAAHAPPKYAPIATAASDFMADAGHRPFPLSTAATTAGKGFLSGWYWGIENWLPRSMASHFALPPLITPASAEKRTSNSAPAPAAASPAAPAATTSQPAPASAARDTGTASPSTSTSSATSSAAATPSMQALKEAIGRAQKGENYEANVVTELQKTFKQDGQDLGTFGPEANGLDGKFGMKTQAAAVAYLQKIDTPEAKALAEKVGKIELANEHDYKNGEFLTALGVKTEQQAALQPPASARRDASRRMYAMPAISISPAVAASPKSNLVANTDVAAHGNHYGSLAIASSAVLPNEQRRSPVAPTEKVVSVTPHNDMGVT